MTTTHFIWDELSDNVLMETDEFGVATAEYTQEPGQFGELVSQHRDGATSQYHFDGLGNTRQLTDENENVTDESTFSAFGEKVASSGATVNQFGFQGSVGYHANPSTEDLYVRARHYRPSIGRWMSEDPVGFIDGPNVYVYTRNGPVNLSDPSGNEVALPIPTHFPPFPGAGLCTPPMKNATSAFCTPCIFPPSRQDRENLGDPAPIRLLATPINSADSSRHKFCGLPTANLGVAGCAPCVGLVIKCPPSAATPGGVALFHFAPKDLPFMTINSWRWPQGCQAIVCGGDDSYWSNCLAEIVISALKSQWINIPIVAISSAGGCGVTRNATKFYVGETGGMIGGEVPD